MMKNEKGFSLLEMLVTMSIFLVIMGGVYFMVFQYGNVSQTEHSRRRMQQESRYLTSNFAADLKNAGAVLTLTHIGNFLGAGNHPFFSGIYPLNNTNFPDGIIVASGDPEAVTFLTAPYTSGNVLSVHDTTVPDSESTPWAVGDIGIIIGTNGFYVFSVEEEPTQTYITIRPQAVYYSGLLNTINYIDPATEKGDSITYPGSDVYGEGKAPVIRLDDFGIYLFKEIEDPLYYDAEGNPRKLRQLYCVTDTKGNADVLAEGSTALKYIISENIWDVQITYTAYENFNLYTPATTVDPNHYYFGGGDSSNNRDNLMDDISRNMLKKLNIDLVSLSDELGGRGKIIHMVPPIGDQNKYNLPAGKFNFRILSLEIEPRNFNISI